MIHVILNATSGARSSPDTRTEIDRLFRGKNAPAEIHYLTDPGHIRSTVHDVIAHDPAVQAIVAAGGDGTVNTVASSLADQSMPLGVLPLGTLNHFAKELRIPLDLAKAVETVVAGQAVRVDVAQVNDQFFVNNASIGIYPNIVEGRERLRAQGHRKWPALARATLEVMQQPDDMTIRLEVNGQQAITRTPFVFVGNNEYQASGFRIGARSRLDQGKLFAYVAPRVHTRDLPKLLMRAIIGRGTDEGQLQIFSATELWVESIYGRTMKVACDGELVTMKTPLHFQSRPGALNVIVPYEGAK
jgi:YegS/Rv2252/BmrU family lipid kinase